MQPVAEDDNSGSGACAPVFNGVRPLLYQVVGSDPEFRKRVHRRLTHFCHGLLGVFRDGGKIKTQIFPPSRNSSNRFEQ